MILSFNLSKEIYSHAHHVGTITAQPCCLHRAQREIVEPCSVLQVAEVRLGLVGLAARASLGVHDPPLAVAFLGDNGKNSHVVIMGTLVSELAVDGKDGVGHTGRDRWPFTHVNLFNVQKLIRHGHNIIAGPHLFPESLAHGVASGPDRDGSRRIDIQERSLGSGHVRQFVDKTRDLFYF
jgi:hypothetical protein